jgi:Mg-chelatase subunit ChlD
MTTDDEIVGQSADTTMQSSDWLSQLEKLSGQQIKPINAYRTAFLLIDCSGSMDGAKLSQAKHGAIGFAEQAWGKDYAVGLVRFSSTASIVLEAMKENEGFRAAVSKLQSGGSTDMATAINITLPTLAPQTGEKVLCIVTDGQPDDAIATLAAADEAKKMRIDIMTIGTSGADRHFLERLATRKELSVKVAVENLKEGITNMARLLPGKV